MTTYLGRRELSVFRQASINRRIAHLIDYCLARWGYDNRAALVDKLCEFESEDDAERAVDQWLINWSLANDMQEFFQ